MSTTGALFGGGGSGVDRESDDLRCDEVGEGVRGHGGVSGSPTLATDGPAPSSNPLWDDSDP